MAVYSGTVIYIGENLDCEYCKVRKDNEPDGFPVCINPVTNCEMRPSGKWLTGCPDDFGECVFFQKVNISDIDAIKYYIDKYSENGWLTFTMYEWIGVKEKLELDEYDMDMYMKWLLNFFKYIPVKLDKTVISKEIEHIFVKE